MLAGPRWRGDRYRAVRSVNIAPAISGAALSGYAQAVPSWLRATLRFLNADLGYYVPNPFQSPPRIIYLSDGGHSDNLGLYALIRRECQQVIAVDAEYEPNATGGKESKYEFEGYRKLVKAIEGERIAMVTLRDGFDIAKFQSAEPFFEGELKYTGSGQTGTLLYIKLAFDRAHTEQVPADVREYAATQHPRFPHDPTTSQSYAPEQFRAYQKLGHYITCRATARSALRTASCSP